MDMRVEDEVKKLSRELESSNTPLPLLRKLLLLMNTEDIGIRNLSQSAILNYFDSLKKSSNHETIKSYIETLQPEYPDGSIAAEFLDISMKAYDLILEQTYNRLIRTFSGSYTSDGTVAKCPKCNSTNVFEGDGSIYEFTEMICGDCNHRELADEYLLENWYPL
jgi:hypothetical protein